MRRATAIAAAGLVLTLLPANAAWATRTLSAPATASFGVTLNGRDRTVSYPLPLTAAVTSGSPGGCNLTIRASRLNGGGGAQLPTPVVTAVGWTCQASCSIIPANARAGSYTSTVTTAIVAGP